MAEPSEEASEERTEPFSQSEIEARLFNGMGVEEPSTPSDGDPEIPLDVVEVDEDRHIRILIRPLVTSARSMSPGSDNCQWLVEHKALAVTQTSRDIKFSVRIPGATEDDLSRPPLWCELYYDPASDKVIFWNRSDVPLWLGAASASPPPSESHAINPGLTEALKPATWRVHVKAQVRDIAVLDFRILEKRPITLYQPQPQPQPQPSLTVSEVTSPFSFVTSDQVTSSMKRPLTPDQDSKRAKRRISDSTDAPDDGVIMFLGPAEPLVFPRPNVREGKELSASDSHALLDVEQGETIAVPGVCELDEYQLTRREPIASTALSAVYTASHSNVPKSIITVKVLKTTRVDERNVIRQAEMWLRESQGQKDLCHESVVRYYGGDARFLSHYMEHIDAKDLAAWRNRANDEFMGTRDDAFRILHDITSALNYIHAKRIVHNDIKPANILYSPERGAVLCDFGLTTTTTVSISAGTPYYIPPEFITRKSRGPASDVWAMGVTMLYSLRSIKLPDARAKRHPKLYWMIAGVHSAATPYKQHGNGQPAINQMRDWLGEVYEAREKLNTKDRLERLVQEMLTPNPNLRITMAKVLQELYPEQVTTAV